MDKASVGSRNRTIDTSHHSLKINRTGRAPSSPQGSDGTQKNVRAPFRQEPVDAFARLPMKLHV
jgi:hypothetical protein